MAWAYLFEAKGIQRYIVETGRRRDLVGASELVARLARSNGGDLLDDIIEASGASDDVEVVRRAGGVFLLCCETKRALAEIRALMRLAVFVTRPGLEFTDALAEGASRRDAIDTVYKSGSGVRENSTAAVAPFGGPAIAFAQRTGRPALALAAKDSKNDEKRRDLDDRVTRPQADLARELRNDPNSDTVGNRFLNQDDLGKYIFPRNLTDEEEETEYNPLFPWIERDKPWSAVIHADLSGVAAFFRGIQKAIKELGLPDEQIPEAILEASRRLEDAVEKAARGATKTNILARARKAAKGPRKVAPARPIVLGGDDITILVRADCAFAFVLDLLSRIEAETKSAMEGLREKYPGAELPQHLSACAGVAFLSATHPFDAGNTLADELCKAAKKLAKSKVARGDVPPSALTFHVMSATVRERHEGMLAAELTARVGDVETRLTFGPYFAGPLAERMNLNPHANDLRGLSRGWTRSRGSGPCAECKRLMRAIRRKRRACGNAGAKCRTANPRSTRWAMR